MEGKIISQYPNNYFKQQTNSQTLLVDQPQLKLRRQSTKSSNHTLPRDSNKQFDAQELWQLLKSFSSGNLISHTQFHGVFLAFGLQNNREYLPHIYELMKFNSRFKEIHQMRKQTLQLRVKHDDVSIVQWLWQFTTFICQNDKNIPIDLLQDILTMMVESTVVKAQSSIENAAKYYSEIHKSQQNDIFGSTVDQQRQNQKNHFIPFFEQLPRVIIYFREKIIFVKDPKYIEENNVIELMIDVGDNNNVFDKLFKHSQKLQDKQQMYQYQKKLNELNHSFTPTQLNKKQTNSSPFSKPVQQKIKQPHHDLKPKIKKYSPSISPSPSQQNISDIKGVDSMILRLQKGRDEQARLKHFWVDLEEKQSKLLYQYFFRQRSKSVQPFDLTAHKYPHTKPQLFIDVETSTGKHQRIGLYGLDDLDKVSQNFGKAHQLSKTQVLALKLRLKQIADKYL